MMQEKRGYYEANKIADFFGLPITVIAGNVIYNGLHWHEHIEILFCKKGTSKVTVGQESYTLFPGDFITINSGITHEIYGGKEGNLQIICSIEGGILGEMEDKQIVCSTVEECGMQAADSRIIRETLGEMAVLNILDAEKIKALTCSVPKKPQNEYPEVLFQIHPLSQEENWFRYHMYLYKLLMILVKYKKASSIQNQKKWEEINGCILYIHEHLGETLNAKILAGELHVSQPTIYRLFSEQMGMHLGEYITTVRLNAVCRYLETTSEKVIDIAYACGFTGLSNFYRAFQLYIGTTPKAYREAHRTTGSQLMLKQPDIMNLNQFQGFHELGYESEVLKEL